ncbi:hypothetical protein VNO80_26746 [Phaseolus coccineus]|uniref:Uncharacterized protein n=1 Tax=Phaseolus coccineus TaxID=3886 RepID=A0AAN9LFE4_PHACN
MFQVQEHTSSTKKKSTSFYSSNRQIKVVGAQKACPCCIPCSVSKNLNKGTLQFNNQTHKAKIFQVSTEPQLPKNKTGEREGERYQFRSRVETGRASLRRLVHPKGEME